jgi:hypothetical protein
MSTQSILATPAETRVDHERGHRLRLAAAYFLAIAFIVAIAVNGYHYYLLPLNQRPFSPQHAALRPSGNVGLRLGIVGVCCFLVIFLYPLRKKWGWLQRQGSSRHWLDFHVVLGLSAPFIIAFHASFKFQGFAGMAFWIMLSVSVSGVVGRYLYSQIPRRVNSTEITLKELKEQQDQMVEKLSSQRLLQKSQLSQLFRLPSEQQIARWPVAFCLAYMMVLDLARPFHVARLRLRCLSPWQIVTTAFGFMHSGNHELETVIAVAREQASLSKRLLFLSRTQKVFHLWHVVHRPFSYTFVVLVVIHIAVVYMLGYI